MAEAKSVIDFVITCEELFAHMTEMKVDEKKEYTVAKYTKLGNKTKVTETDHNMNIAKFNINLSKKITDVVRKNVFKYDDKEGQAKFKELTSSETLSNCFKNLNVKSACKKCQKEFNNILHRSFKKVRVGGNPKQKDEVITAMKMKQKHLKDK